MSFERAARRGGPRLGEVEAGAPEPLDEIGVPRLAKEVRHRLGNGGPDALGIGDSRGVGRPR